MCYIEKLSFVHLFIELQRLIQQRLSFFILPTLVQIMSCFTEQLGSFRKIYLPLCNPVCTCLHMGYVALALLLHSKREFWKDTVSGSHRTLCPLVLYLFFHTIPEYSLYQTVDGERLLILVAAH